MSGRLLAFDIGSKRIGVARTDVLKLSINPVGTFHVSQFMEQLNSMLETDAPIEGLVFGWPLNNGEEGKATERVRNWMNRIKNKYPSIPQHTTDESFSSIEAQAIQIESGLSKTKRQQKERVDAQAAVLILKRFLDENG